MTRLIEFLISLAIVAVLFVVVGVLLPSKRHVSHSVETNRRLSIVYDVVNSFTHFGNWNAVTARDPAAEIKLSGPASGKGARVDYSSKEKGIGSGHWVITDSEDKKKVSFAIENEQWGTNKRSSITLEPTGANNRNVKITQDYDVEYGWNLLGRYAGLYVSSFTGEDIKIGLGRLAGMLAAVPNVDYRGYQRLENIELVNRPAEHVLFVNSGGVTRNDKSIQAAIASQQEWIKRVMEENGLEAVGPVRVVSNEISRENYNFDLVQVVRKKGSGEAAADAALEVKLQGPVKYELAPAARLAKGTFKGYFGELETIRNAVRAWALVNNLEVSGRVHETYTAGVAPAFTENGEFEVYWPVK